MTAANRSVIDRAIKWVGSSEAEQRSVKPWVEGSSPSVSAIIGLIHGVSDLN